MMTAWKDGAGPGCPLLRYAAVSQDDDAFSHFNTLKLFSWPAMERDGGGGGFKTIETNSL